MTDPEILSIVKADALMLAQVLFRWLRQNPGRTRCIEYASKDDTERAQRRIQEMGKTHKVCVKTRRIGNSATYMVEETA